VAWTFIISGYEAHTNTFHTYVLPLKVKNIRNNLGRILYHYNENNSQMEADLHRERKKMEVESQKPSILEFGLIFKILMRQTQQRKGSS